MTKSTKPTALATKGLVVTRQGAADTFGVAPTTVDAWKRKGCPVLQRGARGVEWQFNTADLHKWLCDQQVAMAVGENAPDEKNLATRKMLAQTELVELELAKAKGEVVDVSLVDRALSNAFAEVQTRMRNVPSRTVSMLIGETNEARFKQVLLEEIDASLEKCATLDLSLLDDDESDDEDEGDE